MTDITTRGVDEAFARMLARAGTEAVVLLTPQGQLIRSAVTSGVSEHQAALFGSTAARIAVSCAGAMAEIAEEPQSGSPPEGVTFVRVRAAAREILIVAVDDYLLAVVHKQRAPDREESA